MICIKPVGLYLLVLPEKAEVKRASGIILPEGSEKTLDENKNARGVVVARGNGTKDNPMPEFKNNKEVILFPTGAGIPITSDNVKGESIEYRLLKYSEIIGII